MRLNNGVTLILEIKGKQDDQVGVKHEAARRWVRAVNNWGQLGRWDFLVCYDPQILGSQLRGRLDGVAPFLASEVGGKRLIDVG